MRGASRISVERVGRVERVESFGQLLKKRHKIGRLSDPQSISSPATFASSAAAAAGEGSCVFVFSFLDRKRAHIVGEPTDYNIPVTFVCGLPKINNETNVPHNENPAKSPAFPSAVCLDPVANR